jgi:hypothetical protein
LADLVVSLTVCGGRPLGSDPVRGTVCVVVKSPQQFGRPFTTWSLSKLGEVKQIG